MYFINRFIFSLRHFQSHILSIPRVLAISTNFKTIKTVAENCYF